MGQPKENTPPTPNETSSVGTKFCERKKIEDYGFVDNAMEYMDLFVHASLDEHTACFMASWNKVITKCSDQILSVIVFCFSLTDVSSTDMKQLEET